MLFSRSCPQTLQLRTGDDTIEVGVRVNRRAKHYRLTVSGLGTPVLTVPERGSRAGAEMFLRRQSTWLEARLKRAIGPRPFVDGARLPVRDELHTIIATGRARGLVRQTNGPDGPHLEIAGDSAHLTRRLTDWLKAEARRDLVAKVAVHSARLGVTVKSISVRDQSSRWGSCAQSGRLNFSWRLILAPRHVLDYVAAHEVAHLLQMNHSPAFWAEVKRTLPDMARGKTWLRAHGGELRAYGIEGPAKGPVVNYSA